MGCRPRGRRSIFGTARALAPRPSEVDRASSTTRCFDTRAAESVLARQAVRPSAIRGHRIASSELRLGFPPGVQQAPIGDVLYAFDDLIENNRRRVEVLEEMARAIYREWFVKFRYPGHSDVPLVDSALGPIPEGWAVHTSCDRQARLIDDRSRLRPRPLMMRTAERTARHLAG